jgi:hypothetical protein
VVAPLSLWGSRSRGGLPSSDLAGAAGRSQGFTRNIGLATIGSWLGAGIARWRSSRASTALVPFFPTNDAIDARHYHPSRIGLVPRVDLSFAYDCIKAIVIGPGDFASPREASIRHFLLTHPQYQHLDVEVSPMPFRSLR